MVQKKILKNIGTILVALCVCTMCAVGNVSAGNVTFYVGDIYVDPGTSFIDVSINATVSSGGNADTLWTANLDVFTDFSILTPVNFTGGNDCTLLSSALNISNTHSGAAIICANDNGLFGDFTIAKVTYNISPEACGKYNLIGISLPDGIVNQVPEYVSHDIQNGSVTIKCSNNCCPSGTTCNSTSNLCQATTIICYRDADGDGYVNATDSISTTNTSCSGQFNVSNGNDCNDNNNTIHPGAIEIYNGVDDNCSGVVDEGFCSTSANCTSDYQFCNTTTHQCEAKRADSSSCSANEQCTNGNCFNNTCRPIGWNCDNANSSYNVTYCCNSTNGLQQKGGPNANCTWNYMCLSNLCNNSCAGYVWYGDADNDTYGDPSNSTITTNATQPSGYVNNSLDCNDSNSSIHPGVHDIPNNGIDENCNGYDNRTYYMDLDNDTYGNMTNNVTQDTPPSETWITNASMATDCNDSNSTVNPGANESDYGIDNKDNDCNGIIDNCSTVNSSISGTIYCNASGIMQDKKQFNTTCSESYECLSNNCTGGKCAGYLCYRDADGDGFGNATNFNVSQNVTCPTGYVNNRLDCNDNNSAIRPNIVWYYDADNDTYGNATHNVTSCNKPTSGNCVLIAGDCNDNNTNIHPGATEIYNGVDDNCDGQIDEGFCGSDSQCPSGYYCGSDHRCKKKAKKTEGYTGTIDYSQDTIPASVTLKEFSGVPKEAEGLTLTLNLGKDARNAQVTVTVENKTNTFTANDNGTVTITLPGFGQGEITARKSGFKTLTKTINVYAGTLNTTKISGEKYGDEFKFKVTTKDGSPVKDTKVEIYGKTLMTDANGIVKMTIKTIQAGLESSTSMENYKSSSILFDVHAIGKLNIEVPEKVKQGETITITVRDENKNAVPNAKVTINGVEQTADANGKIEYKVTTSSLTLKAASEGYVSSEQISVPVEAKIVCGDGKCEAGETKENCPRDCIVCGDNVCDIGESYENCPSDCPKPEGFPLWIIGILLVIVLIAAYYFLVMRKKKGGEE